MSSPGTVPAQHQTPAPNPPGMLARTCNASTWQEGAKRSVQDTPSYTGSSSAAQDAGGRVSGEQRADGIDGGGGGVVEKGGSLTKIMVSLVTYSSLN